MKRFGIEKMIEQIVKNGHRPTYDLLSTGTWALYLMQDGDSAETRVAYNGYSPRGATITQATAQLLNKSNELAKQTEKVEEETTCTSSI